jgi:hypothetical protein
MFARVSVACNPGTFMVLASNRLVSRGSGQFQ